MNKKEKQKKLKRYERLGAVKFQKVVFKVEEIKFYLLKKLCPNFIAYFDTYCDWKQKRAIKQAKTEEERKEIRQKIKLAKMAMRKEMNQEKNRNYHINPKRPTEIFEYLNWNKQVHKRGLTKDAICILIFLIGTILQIPLAAPLLIYEIINAAVDFECINIQNYNLCRLEHLKPNLQKKEERIIQRSIEEYGSAAEVIHKSIEQSEKLPTFQEILDNIENKEQLEQMKAMFQHAQEERAKEKKLGGI